VLALTAEKVNDKGVSFLRPLGEKVLYVFDLGYWKYNLFDTIIDLQQHFISRLREGCNPPGSASLHPLQTQEMHPAPLVAGDDGSTIWCNSAGQQWILASELGDNGAVPQIPNL
jgi:hypothetical protein